MGRKDVLDILASLKGSKTIFFSTHILSDVERICDYAAIINEGRLLLEGTIEEIRKLGGTGKIILTLNTAEDLLTGQLEKADWVKSFSFTGTEYIIEPTSHSAAGAEIPSILVKNGAVLKSYEQTESTLEDIFVKVVNGK